MIGAITAGLFSTGAPPVAPNSYESISTVTVGSGGSSSVTFSSIASTYKHLQIRAVGRYTTTTQNLYYNFNGDTTDSNYYIHALAGSGSAVASAEVQLPIIANDPFAPSSYASSIFGIAVIDILDYANTNKFKTSRSLGGSDANGSGTIRLTSSLWRSTSAVSSITLRPQAGLGADFAQYTQFALYGIKG